MSHDAVTLLLTLTPVFTLLCMIGAGCVSLRRERDLFAR